MDRFVAINRKAINTEGATNIPICHGVWGCLHVNQTPPAVVVRAEYLTVLDCEI
jgi:hypothetical protein